VEGVGSRGRPKKTLRGIVDTDCWTQHLNREVAMSRSKWWKLTKDIDNIHKDNVSMASGNISQ